MHAGRFIVYSVVVFALCGGSARGATFYVDPVNGSPSGDGSAANPWLTIEQVIADGLIESTGPGGVYRNYGAPVAGGDTILLRSGYHGEIVLEDWFNLDTITIAAEAGHTPELKRIYVGTGRNWTFRGLTISPSLAPVYERVTIVDFHSRFIGSCRELVVEDCFIYSVLDTSGWTAADWVNKACHGISLGLDGDNLTARGNRLLNVDFGIMVSATNSTAEYNEVTNFSGDGINAMNHGAVVQYNLIRNNFNVDDNHDDGIQGYLASVGAGQVNNVTLRGNVIINRSDPNQPHQGALQGIGCFGGPYVNWVVENNVVMTNHWHGITLYNAEGCTVMNNTVFSPWWHSGASTMQTWIEVWGSAAANTVRNNISHRFKLTNCASSNNLTMGQGHSVSQWFVDGYNFDVHLVAGSPAVDAGTSSSAPVLDADEFHRPMGLIWDIGAYEFGSMPPAAAVAGPDQTIPDANDDGFEVVMLDGSASYNLTGTITDYLWTRDGTYVGAGAVTAAVAMVGETTFTLTITTDTGRQFSDEVTYTVEAGSTPKPGDANGDGDVDLDDFVILKQTWGQNPLVDDRADFDDDGDVDLDDFVIIKMNWGT